MALSTQPYKGARDFYPEDKRFQKYMFGIMRQVAERFGYEEYDAPILEPLDIYAAKSGEEIVNDQTYTFTDRGERQVVIRPEMTPTVSRMVAGRRQELAYPLRWFSIPNLWRYERPQRGRLREHWQLNVDIFGVDTYEAEAEVMQVADGILKDVGAAPEMYSIRINSRKLMNFIFFDYLKMDEVQAHMASKLIDRMHKIPYAEFCGEIEAIFSPTQREAAAPTKLFGILKLKMIQHMPEVIRDSEPAVELSQLLSALKNRGVSNAHFDITVMRGFDYYTGIVFEIFDEDPENNRAMMGGGRYDGLVGLFGVEPVATVGFGFGDVTFEQFIRGHKLTPKLLPETDAYVVVIGDVLDKVQGVVTEMREMGANLAIDVTGKKPEKQMKVAIKKGIPYVIFIGQKELDSELYELRNITTGESEKRSLARIVSIIKDYRSK